MPIWDNVWLTILAGGRGSRFWPLSQAHYPKQFLSIPPVAEKATLIQATVDRLKGCIPPSRILVVGLREHATLLRRQLKAIPPRNLLLEPFGRNTAASIAVAAQRTLQLGGDKALQVVLPADHHIADAKQLQQTIVASLETLKKQTRLICFGIVPRWAETGYGYIELGAPLGVFGRLPVHQAVRFREKPDRQTAENYVRAGNYLWNSGMFVWRCETILQQLEQHMPQLMQRLGRLTKPKGKGVYNISAKIYEPLDSVSIDYGVMERSDQVAVVCTPMVWSDLGGWESIYQLLPKDAAGNVVHADTALLKDTKESLIYANGMQVIIDGVDGLVVVCHDGKLLVCRRERASEIRKLVEKISRPAK